MTRKITILALIAGILLGAAATESFNVYRQSHDSQSFQERLRCKAVADAYVKEDPAAKIGFIVTLDKVDYSPARKTCVAEVEATDWGPLNVLVIYSVRDLLSGESLFSARCTKNCDALKLVYTDPAFDHVTKSATEPMSVPRESEFLTESTPTAVKAWDEKGNPIPNSKRPPSSPVPDTQPGP